MHGRPRKPLKPEDSAASIAKADKLRTLQSQFYHIHHNKIYDKEALDLSAKLLEMNPEVYTAWNYRKLGVESNLQSLSDPDSIKALFDEELRVRMVDPDWSETWPVHTHKRHCDVNEFDRAKVGPTWAGRWKL